MGENSNISWTDHTFNPWLGCQRVSPGCKHCYAETLVTNRMKLNVWGSPKTTERKRTSESTWRQPLAWDRKAQREGKRAKVFCASLADVFEDHAQVAPWRAELFALVEQTPHLDWQLLTKRPENLRRFLPAAWLQSPRANVWLGTTVEDRKRANERVLSLLDVPAVVRFLSLEPLLEDVDLTDIVDQEDCCATCQEPVRFDALRGSFWCPCCVDGREPAACGAVSWVIVGGESGSQARPFSLEWARFNVVRCADAGVACFIKQLGSHPRAHRNDALQLAAKGRWVSDAPGASYGRAWPYDRAGADPAEWPEDLRVQKFPEATR